MKGIHVRLNHTLSKTWLKYTMTKKYKIPYGRPTTRPMGGFKSFMGWKSWKVFFYIFDQVEFDPTTPSQKYQKTLFWKEGVNK